MDKCTEELPLTFRADITPLKEATTINMQNRDVTVPETGHPSPDDVTNSLNIKKPDNRVSGVVHKFQAPVATTPRNLLCPDLPL
ncbi:hypothetical protein JTE90_007649 [Oedothorax gibbosus]|uniref:Uncharacterized protein n=1 Tax=Oedothorax gibbosus TaxID=931172 RepID=A0AAV6UIH3_9ARAC|nr:hypothetical protein JTE90_007649 [Oedothorax gibbosus]